jgi:hypothetical protein
MANHAAMSTGSARGASRGLLEGACCLITMSGEWRRGASTMRLLLLRFRWGI